MSLLKGVRKGQLLELLRVAWDQGPHRNSLGAGKQVFHIIFIAFLGNSQIRPILALDAVLSDICIH